MTLHAPTWELEVHLWQAGYRYVAGLDEVGRGALAGPIVAAAVVFPPEAIREASLYTLHDSKRLTPKQRARMVPIRPSGVRWPTCPFPPITCCWTISSSPISSSPKRPCRKATPGPSASLPPPCWPRRCGMPIWRVWTAAGRDMPSPATRATAPRPIARPWSSGGRPRCIGGGSRQSAFSPVKTLSV